MLETLKNAWKMADLRAKLLYTGMILLLFRIGAAIPVPFLKPDILKTYISGDNNWLGYIDLLSGGAFCNSTLFALGISPYITASIVIQLLAVAIPALEQLAKEGEEGRKILNKYTRYCTVALGLLQSVAYYFLMRNYGALTYTEGPAMYFSAVVIITSFLAGSMLVMWMGEQIDNKGIGNGISMILFAGIVSRASSMVNTVITELYLAINGIMKYWFIVPFTLVLFLAAIVFIVIMTNAERRIPVQYAQRVVGRKMYGGQSTYIPMKINSTGVMPLIFGFAILQFPATIFAFFPTSGINVWWQGFQSGIWYQVVLAVLIIAFTYFYTSITFNPVDISKNMQQNGGIIPGIRQGRATSDYLSRVSGRLTLFSALFLAVLATIPTMLTRIFGITAPFGASSVLIAVSVGIETIRQVEAQMVMRHHKGFLG